MLVVSQGEPCSRTSLRFVLNDKDGIYRCAWNGGRSSIVALGMVARFYHCD